jgi:hypothetical protein
VPKNDTYKGGVKMEKITYFFITPEGSQEMILASIKTLQWQCDCLHEQMGSIEQRAAELDLSSMSVVLEEIQSEWNDTQMELCKERNRLIRLRGYDESGIPF